MKNLVVLIMCLSLLTCAKKDSQKFNCLNIDAAEAYFNLIDNLKLKHEITDSEWIYFLNIKGNQLYLEENNIATLFTDKLRKILVDVYSKKKNDSTNNESDILYKIRSMYRDKDSIYRNHLFWINDNQHLIVESMISRTTKFLPEQKLATDSIPPLHYHALDHDGSANSEGIFISIMAAFQNNNKRLANYEAHEFHHLQRTNILKDINIDSKDAVVMWALDAILNEGLADMVDKDVMLSKESDWWLKDMVNDFYIGQSQKVIKDLNELLISEAAGNSHS